MTDEVQTPPEAEDTSINAAPDEDTRPVVDFEQRYNSLRPEFDRTKQQLAEERAAREALEAQLQQEPEDDDEYEEYDFEDSVARQRLEALEARLAEKERAETLRAQQADEQAYIQTELEAIKAEFGDLSDRAATRIGRDAQGLRDEQGNPDVRRAYAEWVADLETEKKSWVSTKKAHRPGAGAAAKEKVNLDDPAARRDYMASRLDELEV